jgi:hypothetical protein
MATCEICGTEFDDRGVQIVLPGLAKSFDRIDCALRARSLAGAGAVPVATRGALLPLAASPGLFALGGLSAGLAAALAGTRGRVALGGATVCVALLVATTAHLATRGGDSTEASERPQALAPPARYTGDSADRLRGAAVTSVSAQARSAPEVRYTLLAASRSTDVPQAARVITVSARTPSRTLATHTVRARRGPGGKTTSTAKAAKSSSRPGWGHGDRNHSHGGPAKHSQAAKHGKSHKHK